MNATELWERTRRRVADAPPDMADCDPWSAAIVLLLDLDERLRAVEAQAEDDAEQPFQYLPSAKRVEDLPTGVPEGSRCWVSATARDYDMRGGEWKAREAAAGYEPDNWLPPVTLPEHLPADAPDGAKCDVEHADGIGGRVYKRRNGKWEAM